MDRDAALAVLLDEVGASARGEAPLPDEDQLREWLGMLNLIARQRRPSMTQGPRPAKSELSDEEIAARLKAHPELSKRLQSGDATVLADLLEVSIDVEVKQVTVHR